MAKSNAQIQWQQNSEFKHLLNHRPLVVEILDYFNSVYNSQTTSISTHFNIILAVCGPG